MDRNRFGSRARSTLKVIQVIRSIHITVLCGIEPCHFVAKTIRCQTLSIIRSIAGSVYISWLFVVSSSFMYNLWSVPLRITFPYQDDSNIHLWLIADYVADVAYLADTFLIRPRLRFVREGSWVEDVTDCRNNYIASLGSKVFINETFDGRRDFTWNFYLDRCLVADSVGSALSLLWSSKFSSSFPTNDSGIYNKLTFMC